MIPKIINYCWFGGKEEPKEVKKCINSWKKYCPDYRIVRWDESNYDVGSHEYMHEAYKKKRWAFVSDFARLDIIYNNGGIYLDTDVELMKSLDEMLSNSFFFGIEVDTNIETGRQSINIATGLGFGAEKGNLIVKKMIEQYEDAHFVTSEGLDMTPCPIRNTDAVRPFIDCIEDKTYSFDGGKIYSSDYFCPIESNGVIKRFTDNTISIHHYNASWKNMVEKNFYKLRLLKRRMIRKIKSYT